MARRIRITRNRTHHKRVHHRGGVEPTKALAVGNGQKFIEEISTLLRTQERISLLGGAMSRSEAAERLVLLKPDVVVIDVNLDYELGGIDTAFALRRISPSTAFVLVSPFSDPERLSMIPRGLGLDWSYLLSDTGIDATELGAAICSASWSIPYIDHRIDRSRLGDLQNDVDKAIEIVLQTPKRHERKKSASKMGYANQADWNGKIQWFKLPEDAHEDSPESGA